MNRLAAVATALVVVLASITAAAGPALAASSGTSEQLTDAVTRDMGFLGGYTPSEDVVLYGAEANPGWVVFYEEGHGDDLESWAEASPSRVIQYNPEDSQYAVISAPPDDIGLSALGFLSLGTTLRELEYIKSVDVNRRLSINPIAGPEHKNKSAWERPAGGFMATGGGVWGSFDADGAAWGSEVNTSTLQEARRAIDADDVTVDGSSVRIAVLDTGLDYNRELYGSRVVAGKNTITNETLNITDPGNATASDYAAVADGSSSNHGSWVSTAIAGNGSSPNAVGVAPAAEIVAVKVLGDDGSGSTSDIAEGIEYAAEEADVDIISMSLGSPMPSAQVHAEIVEALRENDVTAVVVAAGNSRLTYRYVASPGDEQEVITVAATDAKEVNESESAYFSNVGPDPETGKRVDVGAPGMKITAETADGNITLSGTSMATPLVTGSIALAVDATPSLRGNPEDVRLAIEEHSDRLPSAGVTEVGAGRINPRLLVDDVEQTETQSEAIGADEKSRDEANKALAGSVWRGVGASAARWIPLTSVGGLA